MRTLRSTGPFLIFGLAVGAALLVTRAPSLPQWGERHTPHRHLPPFSLGSGHVLEQTFRWEGNTSDHLLLWLDQDVRLPDTGGVEVSVTGPKGSRTHVVPFRDIPPSGIVAVPVVPLLKARAGEPGTIALRLTEPRQTIAVAYQKASGIYPDGEFRYSGKPQQGDLAFQLRYRRPALGSQALAWTIAGALVLAGAIVTVLLRRSSADAARPPPAGGRRDVLLALLCGFSAAALYGAFLLRPGFWIGPTDFSKDAAYLASAADALRSGAWPTWSHRTCGGMALLGNPEGNTISLGALLALALPPDRALAALLALEAGLAAAGTVALARALGLSRGAAVGAAAVASLSAAFPYRIGEGLTPIGGAVAFLPWTMLMFVHGLRSPSGAWSLLGGILLAAMFLRGDVHVVVGTWLVLAALALILAAKARSVRPIRWMVGAMAAFVLVSGLKVLPYLEQPQLVASDLPPYSAALVRMGLLDDVLFRLHPRATQVLVLHGQNPEAWGNFGATVGVLPLILAGIGLLTRHPSKTFIVAGAAAAFLISEGTLFETVLRHVGPLGSLLRVPSRVFSVFVVFVGLLAGLGLDRVRQDLAGRVSRLVPALLLLGVVLTSGAATWTVFRENLFWDQSPAPITPVGPMQAPHANRTPEDPAASRHPTKLLRAGFNLLQICGDQNNPPPFVKQTKVPVPLASVPSTVAPNRIVLTVPPNTTEVTVRERFTSSWTTREGTILEAEDGSLYVVVAPHSDERTVTLTYESATAGAQKFLLLALTAMLILLTAQSIIRLRHRP
ncbi:MAG: hypothetical protein Q8R32_03205 [bacterium]|nr:hypothetical protein [bacterium]